jgi:hypothetical protein
VQTCPAISKPNKITLLNLTDTSRFLTLVVLSRPLGLIYVPTLALRAEDSRKNNPVAD